MMVTIRENKHYRTKSGKIVGPMIRISHTDFQWMGLDKSTSHMYAYQHNGKMVSNCMASEMDLVSEVSCNETRPALCIEEGKFYINADGEIVGPMIRNDYPPEFPWRSNCGNDKRIYMVDGSHLRDYECNFDLVKEVDPTLCKETETVINIEEGKFYITQNGKVIGPMTYTGSHPYPWFGRDVATNSTYTYKTDGVYYSKSEASGNDLTKELETVSQIEVGKMYMMRNNTLIGPMEKVDNNIPYPFIGKTHPINGRIDTRSYTAQGRYNTVRESEYDIMFEIEPTIAKVVLPYTEEEHLWVVFVSEEAKLSNTGTITKAKMTHTEAKSCFYQVVCKFQDTYSC